MANDRKIACKQNQESNKHYDSLISVKSAHKPIAAQIDAIEQMKN